jgi:hypothetical protein
MFRIEWRKVSNNEVELNFKPDLDETRRIAMERGLSEIQAEILAQLTYLNPLWIYAYDIKMILGIAEGYGVRLCHRSHKTINIDIIYNSGSDAYEVKAYKITRKGLKLNEQEIVNYQDVYFPELEETIRRILSK